MRRIIDLRQFFQSSALILNFSLKGHNVVKACLLVDFIRHRWNINIVEIVHGSHLKFELL